MNPIFRTIIPQIAITDITRAIIGKQTNKFSLPMSKLVYSLYSIG